MPFDAVPTYALYGESPEEPQEQWLHCESIASRSALFDWEIKAHRHQHFFQLLHIGRGPAEAMIEGRWTTPKLPAVITLPPGVVHGFRFGRQVEGHVVTLPIERVEQLLKSKPGIARQFVVQPRVFSLAGTDADRNGHCGPGRAPWQRSSRAARRGARR